jgi:flavorubredoxin
MKKMILIYETQTGATEEIAKILETYLTSSGIEVQSKRISKANEERLDLINLLKEVDAIAVGSPTQYSRIMTPVQEFLNEMGRANYMGRIDFSDKLGIAFGSYGWSGEGVEFITDILKNNLKMKVIEPGLLVKGRPDDDTAEECKRFGEFVAEKILSESEQGKQ